ncbi:unnamed protein product, partial [Vitis vinifera]|uniref:Uncharacterized protein n=1 Tax=Vitis vinifera TaxID=29760 RepID=D7U1F4_VITVI
MKSSSPPRKKFLKDFNVKVATDDIDNVTSSWMLKYPSSALNSFEKIINYPKSKKIVMFLDYDGTLSPVVDGPDRALMSDAIIECFSLILQSISRQQSLVEEAKTSLMNLKD